MNTVIVEDDPIFRDMILDMLPKASISTKIQAVCPTIRQAKEALQTHKPQLLLLDVVLPDGKGIDLLNELDENGNFETIFVTSYDKYAIDAIKKNATDYLLKPLKLDDLNIALEKVQKRIEDFNKLSKVDELSKHVDKLDKENMQEQKIMINTNDGAIFIRVKDIIKLESESNYTIFYLENNKKIIASKTLSVFEEILESLNFMRIHRSYVVNLTKILNIEHNSSNYYTKLSDGSRVEISRRKKKDFFDKVTRNGHI